MCVWLCVIIIFFRSYSGDPLDQVYFPVGESLNIIIIIISELMILECSFPLMSKMTTVILTFHAAMPCHRCWNRFAFFLLHFCLPSRAWLAHSKYAWTAEPPLEVRQYLRRTHAYNSGVQSAVHQFNLTPTGVGCRNLNLKLFIFLFPATVRHWLREKCRPERSTWDMQLCMS